VNAGTPLFTRMETAVQTLVIDDSRIIRTILGRMMRELGFEVTEAGNGREALARLQQMGAPELMLVDWNMPEMNGLEFIRAVRADARYDGTRVMMITTENDVSRVTLALEAGADEYVMKPFTHEVILAKLLLLGLLPVAN
jgi:two-component system chemotaxis response regulator CheY